MKIEYKNKENHNIYLSKLNYGDVFKFKDNDIIFMKIDASYNLTTNTTGIDGTLHYAVDLDGGTVCIFADTIVELLEAKLLITVTK